MKVEIISIEVSKCYPLRHKMLRKGKPLQTCHFDGDNSKETFHLGALVDKEIIGIISVYENDLSDVFNSRTFCLYEDIENLKKQNLAQGGSLDNAIVVKDKNILNSEKLRNEKEFVNHKILDCMGDLFLSGYKIIGKVKCSQGGHKLTNQLLRNLFEDDKNFTIFEVKEKLIPNSFVNKKALKSIA